MFPILGFGCVKTLSERYLLERLHTLQKPSINVPVKTDPCFAGVFHTLNQRRAQLYY